MSTRSGKRIHSSVLECTSSTEQEPAVKSERKTRSKRVKENLEELNVSLLKNKKRSNYVSYPTDDEVFSDTATVNGGENKTRSLRNNALKQQNSVEGNGKLESSRNLIRKSRRGKRLYEDEENDNHENVPAEVTELPKSKKTKKKKKISATAMIDNPPPEEEEAPTKKSKKKKNKGKKTSSIIVEDIPQEDESKIGAFNRSNMSIDSFHSAAGSPLNNHERYNKSIEKLEVLNKSQNTKKKSNNNNTLDKNDISVTISLDKVCNEITNNTIEFDSKSRKSILTKCFVSVARDDLERLGNTLSNGQLSTKKLNAIDTTLNKINTSTPSDLEEDNGNLNISNASNKQSKRRKKNIKEAATAGTVSDEATTNVSFDKSLRKRHSVVKDSTFDKNNVSMTKEIDIDLNVSNKQHKTRNSIIKNSTFDKEDTQVKELELNISYKHHKTRKSLKDDTFDKSNASITNKNNVDNDVGSCLNECNIYNKQINNGKSYVKDTTFDKPELLNSTLEKETEHKKDSTFDKSNNKHLNATYEQDDASATIKKQNKSRVNSSFDKIEKTNSTFEKDSSTSFDSFRKGAMTRKSSIRDATFDKSNTSIASLTKEDFEKDNNIISSSGAKRRFSRRYTIDYNIMNDNVVNTTYEKTSNVANEVRRKSPWISQSVDIQSKLNTTFEKETTEDGKDNVNSNSKSSLISSDNSIADKSEISRISITSDDTTENIVNTTPVLIESSMDESRVSDIKQDSPKPQTPLKREGTFTKDAPEVQAENEVATPTKHQSLPVPAAGCTPYHVTKSTQKKTLLNVTRSIEKPRASLDPPARMTRVMFCSPVDNPVVVTQEKRKIIKSNLKGSNKSFVFEESTTVSRPARKRSYTHGDLEDARVKRTRLTEDLQQSVDRLSRPRTASATAKLTVATPKKPTTPSKPKSEGKVSRTKLPNFAAMHQKQFDKMESLNECQERRAKRAKQLLTPTAPPGLLERISPKNNTDSPKGKELAKEKTDTPTKKLPTLESLRPGFTRFGFKLDMNVNPFSIPSKMEKPKEKVIEKPNGVPPRPAILPSLAGATSVRREVAKQAVMREKSFTEKRNVNRNENRTIIKGVRTNRRFELQMKMRNID